MLCSAAALISCEKEPGGLPKKQLVSVYEYGSKTEGFASCTRETYSYDNKGRVTGIKDGMKVTWENGEITSDGWNTFTVSDVPFHGFIPYNAIPYVVSDDALYRQGFFGKVSAHLPAGLTPGLSLSQEQRTFTYSLEGDRVHAVKETIHTRDIITGQEKTEYSYSRVTWVE